MIDNSVHKYITYGSGDSTDIDICVFLDELPKTIEERKILSKEIQKELGSNFNIILAKEYNGIIIDCTYPKASPDSLNNAVYNTYDFHKQLFDCPIIMTVDRNIILAIYKTVRLLGTYLTKTEYRSLIRPTMNYSFSITTKLNNLLNVDFSKLSTFNQPNVSDVDVWKTWCFYIVQNVALLKGIQIYTKADAIKIEPKSYSFIYRKTLTDYDKIWFHNYVNDYLNKLKSLNIKVDNNIISLNEHYADMITELPHNKL